MNKLIQLPNGHWLDPATVTSIVAWPANLARGIDPRCVVHAGQSAYTLSCPGLKEAEALRDELAAKVNELR